MSDKIKNKDKSVKTANKSADKKSKTSSKVAKKVSKNKKSAAKKSAISTGHKYLDEINSPLTLHSLQKDDERHEVFQWQIQKYGFASCDLWSLDYTMLQLLYERLKMFKKDYDKYAVEDEYSLITIGKKTKQLGEWIDEILTLSKDLLRDEGKNYFSYEAENGKKTKRVWKIWSNVYGAIWN